MGCGLRRGNPPVLLQDKHKKAIQERRERERSQRIQSILNAAKKVFFSKGYLKATMDEIALEAQITKPTIYQYFRTKDDLFFSIMLPVVEDIGSQLSIVDYRLGRGKYTHGGELIADIFKALLHSYDLAPVTFRIVQLFQQTGLVQEFNQEIRSAMNERGGSNFALCRKVVETGMEQGLLKKVNVHEFVDVLWGMFVGIVQLEDIKSQGRPENRFLRPTLKLAERVLAESMSTGSQRN
jgi:AcrR family transcriptional regulator